MAESIGFILFGIMAIGEKIFKLLALAFAEIVDMFLQVTLYPLCIYGAAILAMIFAVLKREKKIADPQSSLIGVSIVIPFRNEAENLPTLLKSLGEQTYKGEIEIILVNDGSTDEWQNAVDEYCELDGHIPLKIIELEYDENLRLTSKQQALDIGVASAAHPLIAFTDADMVLSPHWIETLVNTHFQTGAQLVFGHTSIICEAQNRAPQNFFSKIFALIESFRLEFLFAFAYAFSKLNLKGSCMGNNLLVTKEAYLRCGGQRGVGYSIVEDRALLLRMKKMRFKISASLPFTPSARTWSSRSLGQYYNQTMRWARGGLRPGGGLFLAGLLLFAQMFCLTAFALPFLFICMVTELSFGSILLISIPFVNFFLTWLFVFIAFRKNGAVAPAWFYPAYFFIMIFEAIVFMVSLIISRKFVWKERVQH